EGQVWVEQRGALTASDLGGDDYRRAQAAYNVEQAAARPPVVPLRARMWLPFLKAIDSSPQPRRMPDEPQVNRDVRHPGRERHVLGHIENHHWRIRVRFDERLMNG